jgi:hypothetical protein
MPFSLCIMPLALCLMPFAFFLLPSRLYCRHWNFTSSVPLLRESRTITAGWEFHPAPKKVHLHEHCKNSRKINSCKEEGLFRIKLDTYFRAIWLYCYIVPHPTPPVARSPSPAACLQNLLNQPQLMRIPLCSCIKNPLMIYLVNPYFT